MSLTKLDNDLFCLLAWASRAHGKQPYGDNDYGVHLTAVFCVALENGVTDWDTLAACICHDLLEDTRVGSEELAMCTNEVVVDLVRQCTFTQATRAQQLEAIAEAGRTMTPRALIVKCCDTIANIESLGSGLSTQEVANHKWMKTLPHRRRFASAALDRLQALLVPGRSFRPAEKLAHDLVFKLKYHLINMGVEDDRK